MLAQLCLARDLLTENTEQKASIRLLAQELGMSQYHFIRLFSAVFGLTPHRYRILNQLDRAKHELVQSKKVVIDIAFDCGFSSLGTFSLMFKNYVGMSPRSYRNRYSVCQMPLVQGCFGLMSGLSNSNFWEVFFWPKYYADARKSTWETAMKIKLNIPLEPSTCPSFLRT